MLISDWSSDVCSADLPRLHKAAEFEKVMPVTPIARQARGVEAEHGANLPGAERRDQAFEAGSGHHAARRAAKIVVDHLDPPEAAVPGDLDELVLPSPPL